MLSESTIDKDLILKCKAKMLKYGRVPIQSLYFESILYPIAVDYNLPVVAGLAAHHSFFDSEIFIETGGISQVIGKLDSEFSSKVVDEPLEVAENIPTSMGVAVVNLLDVKVGVTEVALRPIYSDLSTGLTSLNHNDETICGLISLLSSKVVVGSGIVGEGIEDLHTVCKLSSIGIDTSEMMEELACINTRLVGGRTEVEVGEAEVPITKFRLANNRLEIV